MTAHPGDYIAIEQANRLACGQDGKVRLGVELREASGYKQTVPLPPYGTSCPGHEARCHINAITGRTAR